MRRVLIALAGLGLVVGLLGTAVVGSAMAMFGVDVQPTATSAGATTKIPPDILALYQGAAATCPGLPWTILMTDRSICSSRLHRWPGRHLLPS
jgi:hypothetical protein